MDHGQLSMVADKFQWVFSEPLLNACGTEAKFCRRQRIITPFRLGLALTATCASQPVETLADFHRGFNALWGTTVTYKAFYNQVAKASLPSFAILSCRMAAPLPSMTACARCFPDASKWSSPRLSNSIPLWICCAIPQPR